MRSFPSNLLPFFFNFEDKTMSRPSDNKRQREGEKSSTKRQRTNKVFSVDSCPVFVKKIDYNEENDVPSISLSPDLDEVLYPLTGNDFLKNFFRQKAVHITTEKSNEQIHATTRVSDLREEMFGLDPEMILKETSSDNIFLWLREKSNNNNNNNNNNNENGYNSLIRSIEVADVDTAISLHKIAGHATYCRAPPNVEQSLVASFLRATGLGCGQYDPSGESIISMGRGEVETFISTDGHLTNWHFDFQENFTIQLSGIKRWTLQQGTIKDPIRGCTPHYASPEAVESQLKAAHLFDTKFKFGFPETGVTATGDVVSIDVKPGDVFYFPAGMWHKVETIEPGVSINVSLMASNYASVTCQALQHYLFKDERWREPILNNTSKSAVDHLKTLLKGLPGMIQDLENHGKGAESILPPILNFPPQFQVVEEEGNLEDVQDDNGHTSSNDEDKNGENSSREEDGRLCQEEKDNGDIVDPCEFDSYPEGWKFEVRIGSTLKLSKNPLAALHRFEEITSFYGNADENGEEKAFVLNINYCGNEMHQSAVRVVFQDNDEGFVQDLYENERSEETFSKYVVVTDSNILHLKFLVYHGYVQFFRALAIY